MKRNKFGLSSKEYEKLYSVWGNMLKRCYNEECDRFYAYGARGIKVCDEWRMIFIYLRIGH